MAETGKLTTQLTGFKELQEKFAELSEDMRKKLGFQACARFAFAVKREAIANVRSQGLVDTGALERGIAVARIRSPSPDVFIYVVGVRNAGHNGGGKTQGKRNLSKQQKAAGDDPWYWWLHEFGFSDRGGGQVGPSPFLTPAMQSQVGNGPALMGETLWKGIAKHEAKAS